MLSIRFPLQRAESVSGIRREIHGSRMAKGMEANEKVKCEAWSIVGLVFSV